MTNTTNTTIISTLLIALLSSSSAFGVETKGKQYGDWLHTCEKNKDTKKTYCNVRQVISNKQDDKEVPIASYEFSYNEKKELKLIELLPHGLLLQPGTSVVITPDSKEAEKKELILAAKFVISQPNGPVAIADVTKDELHKLYRAKEVVVGAINNEGTQTGFPFSTKGLKEAIAALKL